MITPKQEYEIAMKAKADIESHEELLKQAKITYKDRIREYRAASVDRVLDFIRREYNAGRICNLDMLLCHCQNKLLGNIDGVELALDESYRGIPFIIEKAQAMQEGK